MTARNIVLALTVLLIAGLVVFRLTRQTPELMLEPTPSSGMVESDIEERFGIEIPEELDRAELLVIDRLFGQIEGSAIATIEEQDGRERIMILADLPELESGMTYQAWLARGERGDFDDVIPLGQLRKTKGGFILDPTPTGAVEGFDRVVVSRESQIDSEIETVVLEGSF